MFKEDLNQKDYFSFDVDDLGKWDKIDHILREYLVKSGPKRDNSLVFPKDNNCRYWFITI